MRRAFRRQSSEDMEGKDLKVILANAKRKEEEHRATQAAEKHRREEHRLEQRRLRQEAKKILAAQHRAQQQQLRGSKRLSIFSSLLTGAPSITAEEIEKLRLLQGLLARDTPLSAGEAEQARAIMRAHKAPASIAPHSPAPPPATPPATPPAPRPATPPPAPRPKRDPEAFRAFPAPPPPPPPPSRQSVFLSALLDGREEWEKKVDAKAAVDAAVAAAALQPPSPA